MEYKSYQSDSVTLNPDSPFFLDHASRYWWASERSKGKSVLDCACGKGYGSYILSHNANQVLGIDLNKNSLSLANKVFGEAKNLKYEEFNVLDLAQRGEKFDVITAFEVIEHLEPKETDNFIASLAMALKPGGELIISTPNHDVVLKSRSSIPSFHINNLKSDQLKDILESQFEDVTMIGQFRKKGNLHNAIFSIDYFNLRHSIRNIFKPASKVMDMTEEDVDEDGLSSQNPLNIDHFKLPPSEYSLYKFSSKHWRQAGLSVSICKNYRTK